MVNEVKSKYQNAIILRVSDKHWTWHNYLSSQIIQMSTTLEFNNNIVLNVDYLAIALPPKLRAGAEKCRLMGRWGPESLRMKHRLSSRRVLRTFKTTNPSKSIIYRQREQSKHKYKHDITLNTMQLDRWCVVCTTACCMVFCTVPWQFLLGSTKVTHAD